MAVLRIPLTLLQLPLVRNGYALIASAGLTSVLGLVFWILAARLLTPEEIGLGAALISTLLMIGNIAQLNFGNILNRFLPVSDGRAGRLILFAYATGASAALVFSTCFLFVVGAFVAELAFLLSDRLVAAGFVVATVFWTLFALQDSALAGLRKAVFVPIENAIYALLKIGLLVLFAGTAFLGSGVFAAWVLPLPIFVVVLNVLVFFRWLPRLVREREPEAQFDVRRIVRFFGWDYVGTLAMMTALGVVPLLILRVAGSTAIAEYHLAWTIAYTLYLIGRSMGISLLAEAVFDRARMAALVADAVVYTMIPLTAAVAVLLIAAPWIMGLFGPAYAAGGTDLLRILALSCLPWGFITIYLSLARAQERMSIVATVQVATLILVIGLGTPLLYRIGAAGMAVSWLVANSIILICTLIFEISKGGLDVVLDALLRVGSSFARLVSMISSPQARQSAAENGNDIFRTLLAKTGESGASQWRPLYETVSQSDVRTVFLGEANDPSSASATGKSSSGSRALVKMSLTGRGTASLERYLAQVERLHADARINDSGFRLPEILALERKPDSLWLIERSLPGEDGRITIQSSRKPAKALASAIRAMASLHHRTSTAVVIGDDWLTRWINLPANQLMQPVCTLMSYRRRREAILAFRDEQHRFWQGLEVPLGCGHGDFSPGNILFSHDRDNSSETKAMAEQASLAPTTVEAIIDWDRATTDAPPGFDASHLVLTARAILSGEELGHEIRRMLIDSKWGWEEKEWLSEAYAGSAGPRDWPHDPRANRAIVGLAWLHHVTANLDKSVRYTPNRLWVASNIERVLQVFLQHPVSG